MIDTPTIDWAALSPYLALLAGAGVIMLVGPVRCRSACATASAPRSPRSRSPAPAAAAIALYALDETGRGIVADALRRDRLADLGPDHDLSASACSPSLTGLPGARRGRAARASTTRCCSRPSGAWRSSSPPTTSSRSSSASSGSRSRSTSSARSPSPALSALEAGPQVPDHRRLQLGHPALRQRARLRRDRRDRFRGRSARPAADADRSCSSPGSRCCSSASRSRLPRRRSTSGRPTSTRAPPTPVTGFMAAATKVAALVADASLPHDRVPDRGRALDDHARRPRHDLARLGQPRRARPAQRQAAARVLEHLARGLPAHADRGRKRARRPGAPLLPDPLRRALGRLVRRRRRARARARAAGHDREHGGARLGAAASTARRWRRS